MQEYVKADMKKLLMEKLKQYIIQRIEMKLFKNTMNVLLK